MPATYEKIATTTLGSAATNITFSSIPATYTDLRISFTSITSADNLNLKMRYNSDTGSNYSTTQLYGDGSTAYSGRSTNEGFIWLDLGGVTDNVYPTFNAIDIFNYAGSTFKTCLISTSADTNGSGYVGNTVGLWRSTSAITSVALLLTSGNINAGGIATLYGILKA